MGVTARSSTYGSWCCKLEEHADMRGLSGFFRSLSEAKRAILARGTTKPNLQQACGLRASSHQRIDEIVGIDVFVLFLKALFSRVQHVSLRVFLHHAFGGETNKKSMPGFVMLKTLGSMVMVYILSFWVILEWYRPGFLRRTTMVFFPDIWEILGFFRDLGCQNGSIVSQCWGYETTSSPATL